MPLFPSVEWFDTIREIFNNDQSFQGGGGGTCDATVGVKVGDQVFLLVFEGFDCKESRLSAESELDQMDFYLDMPPDQWQEMLENSKEHGSADMGHTLNTIDLEHPEGLVRSTTDDQYKQDMFYRFNQTFQYFFDASARINTEFLESASSTGG